MADKIGGMREKVTLQAEVRAADAIGGGTVTWTDVATVWAEVAPVSSSSHIQALAQALSITHKITIRYRTELAVPGASRYRLSYRGEPLRIEGVTNPDKMRRFHEILCISGQMEGQ